MLILRVYKLFVVWYICLFFVFFVFDSAVCWLKYGLLKKDSTLVLVNGVGAITQLIFIVVYYLYTFQKVRYSSIAYFVVLHKYWFLIKTNKIYDLKSYLIDLWKKKPLKPMKIFILLKGVFPHLSNGNNYHKRYKCMWRITSRCLLISHDYWKK